MPSKIETIQFHGLPAVQLTCAKGATAVISLFGAQVLSWKSASGMEHLYLSDQAHFDAQTPVRGGIPVCFPQFSAQGKLPRHGFVRTAQWSLKPQRTEADFAMATFSFSGDEQTQALWPQTFEAELTVLIEASRLDIELEISNTGFAPFAFTAALHTYLRVSEVENIRLAGLHDHTYRNMNDKSALRENNDVLTVDGEIDRIYYNVQRPLILFDKGRELRIQAEGFPDTVIWNPWEQKCAQLDDMPPLGFRNMLCVEAAAVRSKVLLEAGEQWAGRQTLLAN